MRKGATTDIPIVFGVGEAPTRLGLVASLAQPGDNGTGVNFFSTEVQAKRLTGHQSASPLNEHTA